MRPDVDQVIERLGLEPHPLDGSFFRETYRTRDTVPGQERSMATAIYYLLTAKAFSRMHRLPTDEIFHFYLGDPVEQLQLLPDGTGKIVIHGTDVTAGQRPQVMVSGGTWQGARLVPGGEFALMGTTMTPGFAYPDYQAGVRAELLQGWPEFAAKIAELTMGS